MKNLIFSLKAWSLSILAMICIGGCFSSARSLPPSAGHPGGAASSDIGDTLQAIGVYGLWIGSIALTLSILGLVGSLFVTLPAKLRSALVDAAIISGALLVVAASIDYLGEHPWILAVIVGITGLILLIRYRPVIEKDLGLTLVTASVGAVSAPRNATTPSATPVSAVAAVEDWAKKI